MKIPAAWVPATAYATGDVVLSNSKWYVAMTTGTSGVTAPSSENGQSNNDGGVLWSFIGAPGVLADDPFAPTLTTITGLTATGSNNGFPLKDFPGVATARGAFTYDKAYSTFTGWGFRSFHEDPSTWTTHGANVTWNTDAPKVWIGFGLNSQPVRVLIDGQYYSVDSLNPRIEFAGDNGFYIFDYGSQRKARRWTVECNGDISINRVGINSGSSIWADSRSDDIRVVYISDSIAAGSSYGPWLAGNTLTQRLGHLMGWTDVWNLSTGGTGYITQSGALYTFGQRVTEALALNPDLIIWDGSLNDNSQSTAAITAAALAAFQAVRAASKVPMIVLGVWPINAARIQGTEQAVQAGVTAFNDPFTYFIPKFGAPVLPWVTGAWNNAARTGSVNASFWVSGDNTHGSDISTMFHADRIARELRSVFKMIA